MSGQFATIPAEVLALGNGHAIAVYAAIAQHANRDGEARPSIARLEQITGWSHPTIQKAIRVLCEAGVLVKTNRAIGGMKRANDYELPLHGKQKKSDPAPKETPKDQIESTLRTIETSFSQDSNDVSSSTKAGFKEVEPVEVEPVEVDTPQPPTGASDDGFETFWSAYPRKVGKQDARKWWDKHKPDDELQTAILAAVAWQRNTPGWRKNNGEYIPHPTTWLNRGSWEDERPNNMTTIAAPRVQPNPDYEGAYDPLRKFTPEGERAYHEQMAQAMADADGITLDEAWDRIRGWAA